MVLVVAGAALALDNGVGRTPALGWSTWNRFYFDVNETLVREMAQAMVETGLRDAGYVYVNIDAGAWQRERDENGNLQEIPEKFPSGMKSTADFLLANGFLPGYYTDLAHGACAPEPGSLGHYAADARFFAALGAGYVKVDFCGGGVGLGADELAHWGEFAAALNRTGHPMYLSTCPKSLVPRGAAGTAAPFAGQVVYQPPAEWTRAEKRAVANAWLVEYRNNVDQWYTTDPARCQFVGATPACGVVTNIDAVIEHGRLAAETGPGGLVDADMLDICQDGGTANGPGLSESEERLEFLAWAAFPSPLILSFDARAIRNTPRGLRCLAMVTNPEVLAINQDPHVIGARLVRQDGGPASTNITLQVLARPLAGTADTREVAVVVLNRGAATTTVTIAFSSVGLPAAAAGVRVRDAGARADVGRFDGGFSADVGAHDARLFRLVCAGSDTPACASGRGGLG